MFPKSIPSDRPHNRINTGRRTAFWCSVLLAVLVSGCAHYPPNLPKKTDSPDGYYFTNQTRTNNSDEILLCLAFSGGGTRAASFSYGLLEALRDSTYEIDGQQRRLLDEVDIISSVSGGSVTAAAYALHGEKTFEVLEPAFLKRNVEGALFRKVLNPFNWPKLWSRNYSRTDLAARYYDKILFNGATFSDLASNNVPFLAINGTDIAAGTRITFNQHVFDVLSSDVGSFPLSRAVAASSAVPGLFAPITLNNYAGKFDVTAPDWVARDYPRDAGAIRPHAYLLKRYLDSTNTAYLHISDGGVSDNLGLRSYIDTVSALEANPEHLKSEKLNKIRKVVFISANAFVHHEKDWDRKSKTPGAIPVLAAADSRTMERYSQDTLLWFEAMIENFRKRKELKGLVEFYFIELDFLRFKEPQKMLEFLNLPTTFNLPDHTVDELKAAARTLLEADDDFKKLTNDLGIKTSNKP